MNHQARHILYAISSIQSDSSVSYVFRAPSFDVVSFFGAAACVQ